MNFDLRPRGDLKPLSARPIIPFEALTEDPAIQAPMFDGDLRRTVAEPPGSPTVLQIWGG